MYKFAIIDNHQSDIDKMVEKIHQVYFSKHHMIMIVIHIWDVKPFHLINIMMLFS